jgi:plastocyanin
VKRGAFAAIALALALLTACSDTSPTVEGTPPGALPHERILGVEAAIHGTATVTRVTAGIEAMDNFFTPTILRGAPGAKVLVILRNGGFTTHNFTLAGGPLVRDIDPGDIREANITFPNSGVLEFFCRFHRDSSGMVGAFRADATLPTPK